MTERGATDLGTTVAGVRLPFCAMNASGAWSSTAAQVRDLARSDAGAIVLKTVTAHPFLHPEYRSLHNPGSAAFLPLVREVAAQAPCPVIASIAGASVEEYAALARAFAEAGAAIVEMNLADPYVAVTLAPCEERETLRALLAKVVPSCPVPLSVKLPERPAVAYRALDAELAGAGVRVVVAKNDFAGFEKLLLEARSDLEVIAVGGIQCGYDVSRALAKGAKAVQVGAALVAEGPGIFARLARDMRAARRERGRG
jgi:dihydroorotate dehydrogenase